MLEVSLFLMGLLFVLWFGILMIGLSRGEGACLGRSGRCLFGCGVCCARNGRRFFGEMGSLRNGGGVGVAGGGGRWCGLECGGMMRVLGRGGL